MTRMESNCTILSLCSKAAEILLECVATFSCVELCSYDEFMALAVITNIINLPRAQLKTKVRSTTRFVHVVILWCTVG